MYRRPTEYEPPDDPVTWKERLFAGFILVLGLVCLLLVMLSSLTQD